MSMEDKDNEDKIKQALWDQLKSADLETTSLRMVKNTVIEQCNLDRDFFKNNRWKQIAVGMADKILLEEAGKVDNENANVDENKDEVNDEDATKLLSTEKIQAESSEVESVVLDDDGDDDDDKRSTSSSKKRRRNEPNPAVATKTTRKRQTTARSKTSGQPGKSTDDEITRLKSWIVKCGVRKQWSRELEPFKTAKEQVGHLKKVLSQLGMTPRYSLEKAKQIREQREFRQEVLQLQADTVQIRSRERERQDNIGSNDLESESSGRKTKSKVTAGGFNIDFLGNQSDSE
ncbi:hypothetical protein V1514DRAFT_326263 [Lipomyces japonicus]|uniref:uncharacterized protein n=1 Tax=Lipomyces japonicus TaxID=56871 RepID=UPI0034CE2937